MTEHDWLILSEYGVTPTSRVAYGLDLTNKDITALPEGLVIYASLGLVGTPLTTLPADLSVGTTIDISDRVIVVRGSREKLQAWIVAVDMQGTPLRLRHHTVDFIADEVRITGYLNAYATDAEVAHRVYPMIWGPYSLLHLFDLTVEMERIIHPHAREIL